MSQGPRVPFQLWPWRKMCRPSSPNLRESRQGPSLFRRSSTRMCRFFTAAPPIYRSTVLTEATIRYPVHSTSRLPITRRYLNNKRIKTKNHEKKLKKKKTKNKSHRHRLSFQFQWRTAETQYARLSKRHAASFRSGNEFCFLFASSITNISTTASSFTFFC